MTRTPSNLTSIIFLPILIRYWPTFIVALDILKIIAIAAKFLLVAAIFQIYDGVQVVVLGALRGLQDVKIPTFITFIAYWMIGLPICYFLGKEEAYGSFGIWLGLLAGLSSAAVLLYLRFNYLTLKLIREAS